MDLGVFFMALVMMSVCDRSLQWLDSDAVEHHIQDGFLVQVQVSCDAEPRSAGRLQRNALARHGAS
jgi:hypothetical protein